MGATADFINEVNRYHNSMRYGIYDLNETKMQAKAAFAALFYERNCVSSDEITVEVPTVITPSDGDFSSEFSNEFDV